MSAGRPSIHGNVRVSQVISGFLILAVLYGAASYHIQLASLYLLRETYRLCEAVGVMAPGGSLGGQVLGFNFQREPAWVHPVARSAATVMATTPALVAALLTYHRLAFGRLGCRATLCGACGRARRSGIPCPCGHRVESEAPDLRAGRLAERIGPARAVIVRRVFLSWIAAVVVTTCVVTRDDRHELQLYFLKLGRQLGGRVVEISMVVYGPEGPFYGEGLSPKLLNFMWRAGPRLVILLSGLLAALLVYHAAASWLWRSGPLRGLCGYRGPTICGRCGYRLAGNVSGCCPECGREH